MNSTGLAPSARNCSSRPWHSLNLREATRTRSAVMKPALYVEPAPELPPEPEPPPPPFTGSAATRASSLASLSRAATSVISSAGGSPVAASCSTSGFKNSSLASAAPSFPRSTFPSPRARALATLSPSATRSSSRTHPYAAAAGIVEPTMA